MIRASQWPPDLVAAAMSLRLTRARGFVLVRVIAETYRLGNRPTWLAIPWTPAERRAVAWLADRRILGVRGDRVRLVERYDRWGRPAIDGYTREVAHEPLLGLDLVARVQALARDVAASAGAPDLPVRLDDLVPPGKSEPPPLTGRD